MMIECLSRKIVNWQIKKKYLPEKDEKLYTYAYGLLIGQVINLIIACLLAIIFNAYMTVFVFLVSYIPLRIYAGGYHARTYTVCTLDSAILIFIVCLVTKVIPNNIIIEVNIIIGLVSGILVFTLAPVEDSNKPLEYMEKDCYRRRSRVIWVIETVIWIVCYCLRLEVVSLVISLGHLALDVMLCLENVYIKKKK